MAYQLQTIFGVNQSSLEFFRKCYRLSEKAKKYLEGRLSVETINKYKLGYCPKTGLVAWFERNNISVYCTNYLGLTGTYASSDAYQIFKNRIMIPIVHAGFIIGFGGRTLENDQPKYINSRTSLIYQKKSTLFNLYYARSHISKVGYALLVEGYFDVLGLVDKKIGNAVATCGTAFSIEQAFMLKRYTKKVYTLFDGDEAGIAAALKAKVVLKQAGIYGGKILLPAGYDPDTYVKAHGKSALRKLRVVL